MENYRGLLLLLVICLSACTWQSRSDTAVSKKNNPYDKMKASMDYFHTMRSFPEQSYDQQIIFDAIIKEQSKPIAKTFEGSWTQQGPINIGGRINSLAISPNDTETMLMGVSYGGIYKTSNGGITWDPIFRDEIDQSISDIAFNPNNGQEIWVGTGDKSVPFTAFTGSGIYYSADEGNSWTHKGLNNTGIIAKVIVDPNNANTIYAATLGRPMYKDSNRGLYKSTDGGNSWSQSLFVNDSTGILDVHMSSENSNILYANSWTRLRSNRKSLISGTENKIFKSTDGGISWQQLSNGLPDGVFTKVSMTIAAQNPDRLYATYLNEDFDLHAVYTSSNGGTSWSEYYTEVPYYNFGWYFDQLVVDPQDENDLYILNVDLHKINNGSSLKTYVGDYHSDCHELIIQSNAQVLLATDGGLYKSTNFNVADPSWNKIDSTPISQYYHVVHKPNEPEVYVGGAQDNSMNEGSVNNPADWERFGFSDGFQARYLRTSPIYFTESQFGNIFMWSGNDATWTGNFGARVGERSSWDTPYVVDEDLVMLVGAQSVYRGDWDEAISGSTLDADNINFEKISPQLTDPDEPYHSSAHIITSIDVSGNKILAGTGDSRVWISQDGGDNWERIDSGLPERFIKSVRFGSTNDQALFVCHSGYKDADSTPHIYSSVDSGQNWFSISGNLPDVGINDLEIQFSTSIITTTWRK